MTKKNEQNISSVKASKKPITAEKQKSHQYCEYERRCPLTDAEAEALLYADDSEDGLEYDI